MASRHVRGFTLIELIMVLLLIGILAVFVLPRANLTQGFDEVGYRDKVRGALEYARKAAIAQRRNVQVAVAGNNVTLTIANDVPEGPNGLVFARALALPAPDRLCNGPINMVCAPPGVTLVAVPANLVFSPLGRPTPPATFTVSGMPAFTVAAESGHVN